MKRYSLLLIMSCLIFSTTLYALNMPGVRYDYYPVKGKTYQALLDDLNRYGPGENHALVSWHVDWSYGFKKDFNTCALINIQVDKTVVVNFPYWEDKPKQQTPLGKEWDRYIKALNEHEKGHIAYATAVQVKIQKALAALPPMKGCMLMGNKANKTAHKILQQSIEAEKQFDKRSKHGKDIGARFKKL